MGWVMMSERELNRIEVLAQIDDGRLTEKPAQPARAPMCEVYTLTGCATVSACGDIPALRNR